MPAYQGNERESLWLIALFVAGNALALVKELSTKVHTSKFVSYSAWLTVATNWCSRIHYCARVVFIYMGRNFFYLTKAWECVIPRVRVFSKSPL